jgi:hypothetical protein
VLSAQPVALSLDEAAVVWIVVGDGGPVGLEVKRSAACLVDGL